MNPQMLHQLPVQRLEEPYDVVHFVWELLSSGWAKHHVVPLEHKYSPTRVHSATNQKTAVKIFTALKTSNLTSENSILHKI